MIRLFSFSIGEPFACLDPVDTNVGAQIEKLGKLSKRGGNLERTTAGASADTETSGGLNLAPGRRFACDLPARHRDLEHRHQVAALLEMALHRHRIVAGIERAGPRRKIGHPNEVKVIRERVELHACSLLADESLSDGFRATAM